ncbi:MAG: ATP-dependent RecD-like DNA helicase [Oscillospiraceae bacterium]|nr:ATP-dependent RecD-like DNA helicase [Oscillospiraceae bacterium]
MHEQQHFPDNTLQGVVERVVFRNEDNGWTVLDVESGGEIHKVVGTLPGIGPGEQLSMRGEWLDHPTFGVQFRADQCERQLPGEAAGILRYLASGIIKRIGAATAALIVKKFGDDTLRIMEQDPGQLASVKGITAAKAKKIGEEYAAQFGLRDVILAFSGYGLTANEAIRCWKRWQSGTVGKIRDNPYLLCSSGLYIGFERADQIAAAMQQRTTDDPRRIQAGLLYVLRHNTGNGHTCLPDYKLARTAAELLAVHEEAAAAVLEKMAEGLTVRTARTGGVRLIFMPHLYDAECYIAARTVKLGTYTQIAHPNTAREIDRQQRANGIEYEGKQREAIAAAVEKGALILTGGPGTGKTTTLRAIIRILDDMGQKVALAAPTGRAAKRLSELTGYEAKTIHRLLEVKWNDESSGSTAGDRTAGTAGADRATAFERNERNQLECDTLVVDEMSMVDTLLFEALLRAMPTSCRLILVGDVDQLPAVGAGSVLKDLIESGALPVVALTEVFRQAQSSRIVTNAHKIVAGGMPELKNDKESDFFFIPERSGQAVVETLRDLCIRRLPARYGYTVWNGLQVLCPGRKGGIGTVEINRLLQQQINPPDPARTETTVEGVTLRVGDKVMHTRNNYEIVWIRDTGESGTGVFNGDIGRLEAVDTRGGTLSVRYDDRLALYSRQDAQDLELAYAVTVHKSQGSEFDAVILPLFHNQPMLLYRNLLYTAVTRAKSLLILLGSAETVREMVINDKKTLRYSGLLGFIGECGINGTGSP